MKLLLSFVVITAFAGLGSSQTCNSTQFECNTGECIPASEVCDGFNDCKDKSDEPPAVSPENCPPCQDEFRCNNGVCIPFEWLCDGENDCGDRSDERVDPEQCPACSDDQFRCNNGRCIRKGFVCDGENDCGDWSDEPDNPDDCPACTDEQFRCSYGGCIDRTLVCDGRRACYDGSDEPEDPSDCPDCRAGEFRCDRGRCLPGSVVCDGKYQCWDNTDELNCTMISKHAVEKSKSVDEVREEFHNLELKVQKKEKRARKDNKTMQKFIDTKFLNKDRESSLLRKTNGLKVFYFVVK